MRLVELGQTFVVRLVMRLQYKDGHKTRYAFGRTWTNVLNDALRKVISGAPNDNFRKNICSEDDLRFRIFGTFAVKFLACLPLLGFSNIQKMVYLPIFNGCLP